MKLKYMLRGMGIGAILMAILMYFIYAKQDKSLSDDEIRARARELGMFTVSEFQEKELSSLKDKLPEISEIKVDEKTKSSNMKAGESGTSSRTKNTPSKEGGEAGLSKDEGDKTTKSTDAKGNETETGKTGADITGENNTENKDTGINKTKAADSGTRKAGDGSTKTGNTKKTETVKNSSSIPKEQKNPKSEVIAGKINFSIASGMSSENVASSLKALGLIDNSSEFNRYLVNNGYADRIKVGTFELHTGESYAEIAAKLTK